MKTMNANKSKYGIEFGAYTNEGYDTVAGLAEYRTKRAAVRAMRRLLRTPISNYPEIAMYVKGDGIHSTHAYGATVERYTYRDGTVEAWEYTGGGKFIGIK